MINVSEPKHQKLPRDKITPEYIAQIRALRRERHEREQRELELKQLRTKFFIKRPILYVPNKQEQRQQQKVAHDNQFINVKIMTYNTLAQTLIRRTTFPDSDDAIKWHNRSKVLMREIKYYHSDILCLQEVDKVQWERFWAEALAEVNYKGEFFTYPGKVHGVAIAWNTKIFDENPVDVIPLILDKIIAGDDICTSTRTRSVALIVALKFKQTHTQPSISDKPNGIIVATTHLFWHLFGTFERTRQCYIILEKLYHIRQRLIHSRLCKYWYTFWAGDFNSQPCDPPYLSITEKPIKLTGRPKAIIECSTSYQYSKRRNGELSNKSDFSDSEDDNDDKEDSIPDNQPTEPRPYTYVATPEQSALVQKLLDLHNRVPLKAVSLYGLGYHLVHPENSNPSTTNSEPQLSHISLKWEGLLDYIFLVKPWDPINSEESSNQDIIENVERDCHLHIKGYLKMPLAKEMPHHTEPHTGEYPSDHLAMMCDLELEL